MNVKVILALLGVSVLFNIILFIVVGVYIGGKPKSIGWISKASCFVKPNPVLNSTLGEKYPIEGTVSLSEQANSNLMVSINLRGFNGSSEGQMHGFHVHDKGDIVTNGCNSAGGHYNPEGKTHGDISDKVRHVGDWGNVEIGKDGILQKSFQDSLAKLNGNFAIIGRAIVIHELPDDLGKMNNEGSMKTGNAGRRLACCVIVT